MPQRNPPYAPVGQHSPLWVSSVGTLVPVGLGVSTTSGTSIVAGTDVVVTPASMANIYPGQKLNIANGTGTPETVVVKGVTATTFTADCANNHSGAYTICSVSGTFLGKLLFTDAGTAMTLTLYNGHPSVLPHPATSGIFLVLPTASVVLGESQPIDITLDYGLFYTYTGTTAGKFLLTYLDQQPA